MIHGIGTDIVRIDRIQGLLDRWGDRFAQRVLGPRELAEFAGRRIQVARRDGSAVRYLAKRFAAKEAFSKALGIGIRPPMSLRSLEVLNDDQGKPQAYARRSLAPYLNERRLTAHVSLSDEVDSAVAFVILERIPDDH